MLYARYHEDVHSPLDPRAQSSLHALLCRSLSGRHASSTEPLLTEEMLGQIRPSFTSENYSAMHIYYYLMFIISCWLYIPLSI